MSEQNYQQVHGHELRSGDVLTGGATVLDVETVGGYTRTVERSADGTVDVVTLRSSHRRNRVQL